jgi:hypothetical protein
VGKWGMNFDKNLGGNVNMSVLTRLETEGKKGRKREKKLVKSWTNKEVT